MNGVMIEGWCCKEIALMSMAMRETYPRGRESGSYAFDFFSASPFQFMGLSS